MHVCSIMHARSHRPDMENKSIYANFQSQSKQFQPHSLHEVPGFSQGKVLDVETALQNFDELEAAGESIPFDDDEDGRSDVVW